MRTTVSFADVLEAARLGRARIAPEIAGYLALGVADALVGQVLPVDPRSCALTEEGAILVLPSAAPTRIDPLELEQAIRQLLGSLLEVARGGGTTLAAVARRPASSDIPALIGEIEAALIPVNRAAARRALARLSRETAKARDEGQLEAVREKAKASLSQPPLPEREETTEPVRVPSQPAPSSPPEAAFRVSEPPREATPRAPEAEERAAQPSERPSLLPSQPPPGGLTRADELLARFSGAVSQSDKELARELKVMAGLEPTPPPPAAIPYDPTPSPPTPAPISSPSPSPSAAVAPAPVEEGFEAPFELPQPSRSRTGSYLLGGLLLAGLFATLAAWMYYPEFFAGK